MIKIDEAQLIDTLEGRRSFPDDMVIYNVDLEMLVRLKGIIRDAEVPNALSALVDFKRDELQKLSNLLHQIPKENRMSSKVVCEDYVAALILREIFEKRTDSKPHMLLTKNDIEGCIDISMCEDFRTYCNMRGKIKTPGFHNIMSYSSDLSREKKDLIIHFFLQNIGDNKLLQQEINAYLGSRGPSVKRAYTDKPLLACYYDPGGNLIQGTHDFFEYDGVERIKH